MKSPGKMSSHKKQMHALKISFPGMHRKMPLKILPRHLLTTFSNKNASKNACAKMKSYAKNTDGCDVIFSMEPSPISSKAFLQKMMAFRGTSQSFLTSGNRHCSLTNRDTRYTIHT